MSRKEQLEFLEKKLELILREISEITCELNSPEFDFYNETHFKCNHLHELTTELQDVNDDICDILDYYFDMTGEYPTTKHYGT